MENLAPNGKKSNLTPEQYNLVRTAAFKKWFGDWENKPENSSKVVDDNGEPLVVFHGTIAKEQFKSFDFDKADLGFHFGTYQQANDRSKTKIGFKGYEKIIASYFLNIRKLFSITDIGEFEYPQRYLNELLSDNLITEKEAKENGFFNAYYKEDNKIIRDFLVKKYKNIGFEYNNQYEGKGKSFIALNNNQMKLADGSNTTFDAENPDIRYKVGGSLSKTPSPLKDRIYGSKTNKEGSAASKNSAKDIQLSSSVTKTLENKMDEYNAKHPNNKVTLATLKAVFRRGAGAYSNSHRPTISGGRPNSRSAWAFARVNKFLLKKGGTKVKAAYVQDDDLMEKGAILNSSCKTYISQNESVLKTGYYLNLSEFSSMIDPYGQIPLNLTHTLVTYNSGNQEGLSLIDTINPINLQNELADILNISINKSQVVVGLYIEMGKKLKSISQIEGDDIIIIDRDKLVCKSEKDDNIMERGGLLAPNLKPSNLTPEQYKLVRTPQFKAWFGDWEKHPESASKVVDENGEPMVVYRGMPKKRRFGNVFKYNVNLWGKSGIGGRQTNWFAFYFTNKKEVAENYGGDEEQEWVVKSYFLNVRNLFEAFSYKNQYEMTWKELYDLANKTGEPIYYLNYKGEKEKVWGDNNFLEWKNHTREWENKYIDQYPNKLPTFAFFVDWTKNDGNQYFWRNYFENYLGYNGLVFYETSQNAEYDDEKETIVPKYKDEYSKTYGVFKPNQIKLADGTNITFDANNPDIRYDKGGLIAPNGKKSNLTPEHEYKNSNLIIMNQNKVIYDSNDKYAKGGKIPNDLRELPYFDKAYQGAEYNSFSEDEEDRQKSDRWFELMFKHQKERIKLKKAELEEFKNLSYQLEIEDYEGGGEIEEDKVIIYHEKQGNWLIAKNTIYAWVYEKSSDAASKLESGEYDWVLFPISGGNMFMRGYVPPLKRVWTKKFQKNIKGSEKLLGIVKAYYDEQENKLYIMMMTTRKDVRRKGINSLIVKTIRENFNLEKDQVVFDKPTDEGTKFMDSGKFEQGGNVGFESTKKLIDNVKKYGSKIIGRESVATDGTKYRYDTYIIKEGSVHNWLVNLFEKAAEENGKRYATNFYFKDIYSIAYDRPKYKGVINGKIQMSELIEHPNMDDSINTTFEGTNPDVRYANGGELNWEAQMYVDILNINPNQPKYKDLLKRKYNIDYDIDYSQNKEPLVPRKDRTGDTIIEDTWLLTKDEYNKEKITVHSGDNLKRKKTSLETYFENNLTNVQHKRRVQMAIDSNKYEEAIKNGQMTRERANEIIKSALGIVPHNSNSSNYKQGGMIKDVNGFLKYTIDKENNEIIIDNIKVDVQRRGTGKKMINEIKELSRELDIPITLYAEPQDESINDDELREFYLSQGFDYHPDDVDNKYFVCGN